LAALSWLQEARAVCHLIATQSGMGQQIQTVRYSLIRRHVIGNYLVYFNPNATGIDVVRVVHRAREQERLV
jgi:plasmid stabilization system protein ParE